jgi:hypothetical protein
MPFYRGDAARVDDLRRAVTHGGIFDVGRVGPERGRSGRCPSSGQPLARASVSYLSATVKLTVSHRETHRHQLVILSAASQRQDHGLSFPPTSRRQLVKSSLQAPRRGAHGRCPGAMRCRSGAGTTTNVRLRCESRQPVSARSRRPGTAVSWSPQVPRAPLHRLGLAASRSTRGLVPGSASIRAICAAGISGGATTWKGLQAHRDHLLGEEV